MSPALRDPRPTLRGLARRTPALAVVLTALVLGAAVAAVSGTGVVLGSRLAPAADGAPRPDEAPRPSSSRPGGGSGSAAGGPGAADPSAPLPDRVGERARRDPAGVPPVTRAPGATDGAVRPGTGPYPGVWPYTSWEEVEAHIDRGDPSFTTAEDTALRFAGEVAGTVDASLGEVRVARTDALVEVRTGTGRTTVALVRPAGDRPGAPWGVVSADGDVSVAVAAVEEARVRARVQGAGRPTVALDGGTRWRGVAVAAPSGEASVRVEPGSAGPAALVALAGDPRAPAAFAVTRVEVGVGAPLPTPPADARAAAVELRSAVADGDLSGTWERLGDQVRRAVLDWRGLAARWDRLGDHLAPFTDPGLDLTTVGTPAGAVDVVAAGGPADVGGARALVFRERAGTAVLGSLEPAPTAWSVTAGSPPVVTARGPDGPAVAIVDGVVVPAAGDGAALRVPIDGPPGDHRVVVLHMGGELAAAATVVTTGGPAAAPPDAPPPSTAPPAGTAPPLPAPEEPPPSTVPGREPGPAEAPSPPPS